jgi:hypothetical protein
MVITFFEKVLSFFVFFVFFGFLEKSKPASTAARNPWTRESVKVCRQTLPVSGTRVPKSRLQLPGLRCGLPPARSAMVAAVKGTQRYQRKLAKNKLRKQRQRQAAAAASPIVVQARVQEAKRWQDAVRRAQRQADTCTRKANAHFRKVATLEKKVKWLAERLATVKDEVVASNQKLKDTEKQLQQATGRAQTAERTVATWTLWWSWLQARVTPREAGRIRMLGEQRPRTARDRAGPHGSQ